MNWFKSFWQSLNEAPPGGRQTSREAVNNFTPRAQQVLHLASKEAARFNHNFVGTEHVLLGLIQLGQGTAVAVLSKMGLDLEAVRREVEKQVGTGPDQKMIGAIPYTPRVKRVLSLAAKEATELHHTYVGTEHLLLGLLGEGDGVAARVLVKLKVDIERTRNEILNELDPNFTSRAKDAPATANEETPRPRPDAVDTNKRYDVYCREHDQEVLYRNALFKGAKKLFGFWDFIEVERENGERVFVARHSITKFCEHSTTPRSEKTE